MTIRTLKRLTPPILWDAARSVARRVNAKRNDAALFDGHDDLFRAAVEGARLYGEYGCGTSTEWVLRNTEARVISVETDPVWAEKVKTAAPAENRLSMQLIDVGAVGAWGRPLDYSKRGNFSAYAEALWQNGTVPDVILIDGRFRVFCFLTCLLRAPAGTVVIFDDYIERPYYHIVEEFTAVSRRNERQAIFTLPGPEQINRDRVTETRGKFEFVRD